MHQMMPASILANAIDMSSIAAVEPDEHMSFVDGQSFKPVSLIALTALSTLKVDFKCQFMHSMVLKLNWLPRVTALKQLIIDTSVLVHFSESVSLMQHLSMLRVDINILDNAMPNIT